MFRRISQWCSTCSESFIEIGHTDKNVKTLFYANLTLKKILTTLTFEEKETLFYTNLTALKSATTLISLAFDLGKIV